MAHCDEKNAKTPQQCKAIKDNPQIHKDYSGGSVGHDIDHPGYSGDIGYGVESSNEVGKEKLSAKGSLIRCLYCTSYRIYSIYCKSTINFN